MQQHKTVISCDKHIPGNWYALREWQSIACQLKKIFYILASFLLISQPAEIIRGVLNLTLFYCNSYLKIILSYLLHIHYMWLSTRILFTRIRNFKYVMIKTLDLCVPYITVSSKIWYLILDVIDPIYLWLVITICYCWIWVYCQKTLKANFYLNSIIQDETSRGFFLSNKANYDPTTWLYCILFWEMYIDIQPIDKIYQV